MPFDVNEELGDYDPKAPQVRIKARMGPTAALDISVPWAMVINPRPNRTTHITYVGPGDALPHILTTFFRMLHEEDALQAAFEYAFEQEDGKEFGLIVCRALAAVRRRERDGPLNWREKGEPP